MNNMKIIQIEKVTLNIGVGKPGKELEKAKILLETISGMRPAETLTTKRIPGWSLRPGLAIGCKTTLRGTKAAEVLKTLLQVADNKMLQKTFDSYGNFSFGVKEYLDVPSLDYIPEVGIMGLEVAVSLQRKGYRIKRRNLKKKRIPRRHAISQEEAIAFAQEHLGVKIVSKEELDDDGW